jgi:hypothetical protein
VDEIERVAPVEGATVVAFDYAIVGAALGVIRAVQARVGERGGAARSLWDAVVVNWEGRHRGWFDEANMAITTSVGTRLDGLDMLRSAMLAAVDDANETQTIYNQRATHPVDG